MLNTSLTHWGRVTHICVSKLTIFGSDNGLSPEWHQANIWTNAGILLIGTLGTNFSEILSEIHAFSFKKMHLKTSSAKRRPFCLGLNMLKWYLSIEYIPPAGGYEKYIHLWHMELVSLRCNRNLISDLSLRPRPLLIRDCNSLITVPYQQYIVLFNAIITVTS